MTAAERFAAMKTTREDLIRAAAGMWKDRRDLPDFDKLRAEWDRRGPEYRLDAETGRAR